MPPRSRLHVLLPLYVYPAPDAWNPLHRVIREHPKLNFTIVVNPNSGPGTTPLPDSRYIDEIITLNSYRNVTLIAYIAFTYGNKPLAQLNCEIDTYNKWTEHDARLKTHGVFLDETPFYYNEQAYQSMLALRQKVKSPPCGDPNNLVVHNPGCVPDLRYTSLADVTVIFEQTYSFFLQQNPAYLSHPSSVTGVPHFLSYIQTFLLPQSKHSSKVALHPSPPNSTSSSPSPASSSSSRSHTQQFPPLHPNQCALMIHSCPPQLSHRNLQQLTRQISKNYTWIFLTDLSEDYYSNFSQRFDEFVACLDSKSSFSCCCCF